MNQKADCGGGLVIKLRKRGNIYHIDYSNGRSHLVRGSLGTKDKGAAEKIARKLEKALLEGPGSNLWSELKTCYTSWHI